ncbi:hypothetical protein, partial [Streptomyces sp. NPDC004230]
MQLGVPTAGGTVDGGLFGADERHDVGAGARADGARPAHKRAGDPARARRRVVDTADDPRTRSTADLGVLR